VTAAWKKRPEGGGRLALWLIRTIALHMGRPVGRALLYPITLYFLLVRGPERRASRAYLARVLGRPARLVEVARHIHCFAATILDRVFLLTQRLRMFDVRVFGREELHEKIDLGRGVLLFGSHHGSFEVLRVLSTERPDVDVRVLLDRGQNRALTQLLEALDPAIAATVIDAGQPGTSIVLALKEAAEAGALVGLLVDRARPGEPVQWLPFLGSPAPLPTAPMLIAATLGIPVVLCFGLYRGGRRYDLHFEVFSDGGTIPRRERAERIMQMQARYVQRLEHYVRMAPYNWFNFYDFWHADDGKSRCTAGDAAVLDAGNQRLGD
jgi:predicted LPLAT superfamily acyltransferase